MLRGPARPAWRGDTLPLPIDPEEEPQIVREQLERAARAHGLTTQIVERVEDRLIERLQALVEQEEDEE
jgi:chorismate mutase